MITDIIAIDINKNILSLSSISLGKNTVITSFGGNTAPILMIENLDDHKVWYFTYLEKMSHEEFINIYKKTKHLKIEAIYDYDTHQKSLQQIIDKIRKEILGDYYELLPTYSEVISIN